MIFEKFDGLYITFRKMVGSPERRAEPRSRSTLNGVDLWDPRRLLFMCSRLFHNYGRSMETERARHHIEVILFDKFEFNSRALNRYIVYKLF